LAPHPAVGEGVMAACDADHNQMWSTQYGCGDQNEGRALDNNADLVWMVGKAYPDWTLRDFDGDANVAYFKGTNSNGFIDGTIARFKKEEILAVKPIAPAINEGNFIVYPNPSTGQFNLQFAESQQRKIVITDIAGRVIQEVSVNSKQLTLEAAEWSSGTYTIAVYTNGVKMTRLFLKQ